MVESGLFYGTVIDPVIKPMRKKMLKHIQKNDTVIDIACGTGAQVFELASICKKAVGVDSSESMIRYAKKKQYTKKIENVEFKIADATKLAEFPDKLFSISTTTLALHQFKPELFQPILNEMIRISDKIIIIDYHIPLPKNIVGVACKTAEFFAGREHNSNFKKFTKAGGLEKIFKQNKIKVLHSEIFGKGSFQLTIGKNNEN
jgi:ubiquinone/menaquinone biosynthesis C-methylase UbiE